MTRLLNLTRRLIAALHVPTDQPVVLAGWSLDGNYGDSDQ